MTARKVVLTGGPSSGKTTLIKTLEERGYSVIHEVARKVIEKRKHIPLSKNEWIIRQKLIYQEQLKGESNYSGKEILFLDRGAPDIIAYSKYFLGYIPFEIGQFNYHQIFQLERLPFVDDGLRVESGDKEAQIIHEKILSTYNERGYSPIHVPVFPAKTLEDSVSMRIDFILSKLREISDD